MLDAGDNPRTVQEFVGHSDPGFMLRQYARLGQEQKRGKRRLDAKSVCKRDQVSNDEKQRKQEVQ